MFESMRRDLAFVPRWSILRVLHRQSVAEHSFYVCCYGLEAAKQIDWRGDRGALAEYLLRHDEGEAITSDIPGPIKELLCVEESLAILQMERSVFGAPVEVGDDVLAIRRAADWIDSCLYLAGEIAMGNETVRGALRRSWLKLEVAILDLPGDKEKCQALLDKLKLLVTRELENVKSMSIFEDK